MAKSKRIELVDSGVIFNEENIQWDADILRLNMEQTYIRAARTLT